MTKSRQTKWDPRRENDAWAPAVVAEAQREEEEAAKAAWREKIRSISFARVPGGGRS